MPIVPTNPTTYPNGTFIKTDAGYFYIVSQSKRFRIITKRVLDSWSPPRVAITSEAAVSKYRITSKLKFRNGSLIHNLGDGKIYLIVDGERRHVTDPDFLDKIGATWKDVVRVSLNEVNLHPEGEPF